ncbi:hypothetical protein C8Q77DRAFT_1158716 [Trametes polyzona]|nr:hypothetical protein C8Q77DRAFT_1158716 [Trametes polyzona]
MHLVFASNSPTNSPVVDSETGQLLFSVSTPHSLTPVTTVTDSQGGAVGEYKRGWIHDEVVYKGQSRHLSDWLVKNSVFSRRRKFEAPNGKKYEWQWGRLMSNDLKMVDCDTGKLVAQGLRKEFKLFSQSQKLSIEVTPDGAPIMDAIVLTFVICELLTRKMETDLAAAQAAT